jgi:hypothetical protein
MGHIIEENLEVKFPTIWIDGRAEVGRVREEKGRNPQGNNKRTTR